MLRHHRLIIGAHRGASAEAPESTAAAIRRAITLGVGLIELDVAMTRDRRLVIFHDERLERTTNGRGRLTQMTYAEIARLDAGSWFARRFAGERVLLASEALAMIPRRILLNLELKRTVHPATLIRRVVSLLRWTRSVGRVLISSFDARLVAAMRDAQPRAARALLCSRRPAAALRTAIRLECRAFHPHHSLVTAALVDRAHAAGLAVTTWTVDAPADARRLARLGIDGLISNVPGRVARALR